MKKDLKYKIFIGAFLFLYVIVAFISFMHSIQFFNVGNEYWMSILLGGAYELGQAVVLASILLSDNKKSLLTWFLFIILTCVQVIGNVFSVYKYISLSAVEYYKFIQEPLLFWIQGVNEQTVKVIISWITGALLPIVALGMTGMVASNIQIINSNKNNKNEILDVEDSNEKTTNDEIKENDVNEDIDYTEDNSNEILSSPTENIENPIIESDTPKEIEVTEDTKKDLNRIINSSINDEEPSKNLLFK